MLTFPLLNLPTLTEETSGTDNSVQYNNGNGFGGDSSFTYNPLSKTLRVPNLVVANSKIELTPAGVFPETTTTLAMSAIFQYDFTETCSANGSSFNTATYANETIGDYPLLTNLSSAIEAPTYVNDSPFDGVTANIMHLTGNKLISVNIDTIPAIPPNFTLEFMFKLDADCLITNPTTPVVTTLIELLGYNNLDNADNEIPHFLTLRAVKSSTGDEIIQISLDTSTLNLYLNYPTFGEWAHIVIQSCSEAYEGMLPTDAIANLATTYAYPVYSLLGVTVNSVESRCTSYNFDRTTLPNTDSYMLIGTGDILNGGTPAGVTMAPFKGKISNFRYSSKIQYPADMNSTYQCWLTD